MKLLVSLSYVMAAICHKTVFQLVQGSCLSEYPVWVSCVTANIFDNCVDRCNLETMDTCDGLVSNQDCCPDCQDTYIKLLACSGCATTTSPETESVEEPQGEYDLSEECEECLAELATSTNSTTDAENFTTCADECVYDDYYNTTNTTDTVGSDDMPPGFELGVCSGSIMNTVTCLAKNCPNFDQACDPPAGDPDTCEEAQTHCNFFAGCCGDCGNELSTLVNKCTPFDEVCELGECDVTTPTTGDGRTLLSVTDETNKAGEEQKNVRANLFETFVLSNHRLLAGAELDICLESIGPLTACIARTCPTTFELECDPGAGADTCGEVQLMCDGWTSCCGGCGQQLANVLRACTPGEGGTCGISTCGAAEAEPKTSSTENGDQVSIAGTNSAASQVTPSQTKLVVTFVALPVAAMVFL